jgi:hypothetical protein
MIVVTLSLAGCHRGGAPASRGVSRSAPPAVIDPVKHLYEQMRTGAYQLSAGQDSLQTATELSEKLAKVAGGTASHGFAALLSKLNAAGEELGDYTDDPPAFDEFKKDVSAEDDQRLNAIQAANEALGEIADGQDIVENLLAGAPAEDKPEVLKVQDQLDDTVDAVETAIADLGGKVDDDDSVPPGSPAANGAG